MHDIIKWNPFANCVLNRFFFFSLHFLGGEPNKVCKLNIVNLNKQAKLFSQGMHPVIRVGDTGKWERTKYSPVYHVSEFYLFAAHVSWLHIPNIIDKHFSNVSICYVVIDIEFSITSDFISLTGTRVSFFVFNTMHYIVVVVSIADEW